MLAVAGAPLAAGPGVAWGRYLWLSRAFAPTQSNIWIIYPFLAYALMTAGRGGFVYGRKPVSGSKIKREIGRQSRAQR